MFEAGYLPLFSVRGVPVRAHWTTPFGALLFSRFEFVPGYWFGFLALIVLHELGHAVLVQRQGLEALSADIHAFGGQCVYQGPATPLDVSIIAWGGVLAQLAVLAGALLVIVALGQPDSGFLRSMLQAFVYTNVLLIGLNLLPFAPFDGQHAWRYFGYRRWEKRRRDRSRRRAARPRFRSSDEITDEAAQLVRTSLAEARRTGGKPDRASTRPIRGGPGFANRDRKC